MKIIRATILALLCCLKVASQTPETTSNRYGKLLQDFVDMRFGMFLCYNIMSYGASWGEANYDISTFNPKNLNTAQWADAAVSAQMKFGLLTTKHHEGFCLWDSKVTDYDVASTPYKKDIVKQYVESFRKKGLKVGLYYSIWDSTHGIDKNKIGPKELDFIKTQITELLTNYGKIDYFVVDGWFWRMGHHEVPFSEIRELIRKLQPDCLLTDHTHLQAPYQLDIPYFEGPFGAFPKEDNQMASALGHCSFKGNGWFWSPETPNGMFKKESTEKLVSKLKTLESRYCNFMLNCMPNRDGLLDPAFISLLSDIGKKWSPNESRIDLPLKKRLIYSAPIVRATASSGEASYLIDATQYKTDFKHWVSDASSIQTLTFDLGRPKNIDIITLVPNHKSKPAPETALSEGNILECKTYISNDNEKFKRVSTDSWPANTTYRSIDFDASNARYVKIEILKWKGKNAIIAEVEIGSSTRPMN
ncbi:alpha-L-fucosidase [Zobellia galactanivorans]|uniref:alpha-L-fucosidase n=1 Tax=Zobellia galactanivorans (strain DSM 12802 / CCUG 47099 / CIP 106680 / NCIMB 13871 / Dsij) TaxID=63186 RepID=UPI0026E202CE|nr:alpha-L-fucosidase [Zobellia galactanivorans]MDO6809658.1 alpha-L-fucosidase [Zobellia galactanivorans]